MNPSPRVLQCWAIYNGRHSSEASNYLPPHLSMKTLIALLTVTACSFAAEAPFPTAGQKPQGALLVLPLKQAPTNSTNSTTIPATNNKENLEEETARIMERLRQEQGSKQGVYHVYLQDGRLQRVEYTAAPIRPGQQVQQAPSNNYNQKQQTPEILSPEFASRRGVYFVQVPQERIQALQASRRQFTQKSIQDSQDIPSFQYNQQPATEATVRYLPIQLGEDRSQYRQQQQQAEPTGYLASVQYSQVEPIQGPVYSYKPQPLTRILRYAPVF